MTTTAPAAPAETKTRTKTTYVILREKPATDNGAGTGIAVVYEPVTAGVPGNNAEHALKVWAESLAKSDMPSGKYLAIAARSFKPTPVKFEQTTVVKVG